MPTLKVTEPTDERARIAREHSALFPTRLALARWTGDAQVTPLDGNNNLPLRAAWYAQAQRNFQAWLDLGGFTQHDEASQNLLPPPPPAAQADPANVCLD